MSDFQQFQLYYEEHIAKVYAFVKSRTNGGTQLAEDLVSEIFLKALEKFNSFSEEQGSFNAWIFRITKNHLIDYYRSAKRKSSASIDELENVLKSKEDTSKKANSAIEEEKLKAALAKLPENKQEIITLRYISGYSYKEIAEITGEAENSIRVSAHRILKELKSSLYEIDYNDNEL